MVYFYAQMKYFDRFFGNICPPGLLLILPGEPSCSTNSVVYLDVFGNKDTCPKSMVYGHLPKQRILTHSYMSDNYYPRILHYFMKYGAMKAV